MNFVFPSLSEASVPTVPSAPGTTGLEAAVLGSRILVVDDQKAVRELIRACLNAGGYSNLTFAEDGVAALEAVEVQAPDLVILDLQMPRMGGLDVCRTLRASAPTAALPVLVETAADSAADRTEVFRSGATDMIGKPINAAELLARVRIHLQNLHMVRQLSAYRESMERELATARRAQDTIMPSDAEIATLQARFPVEIRHLFQTCDALGGDLWGVYPHGEDTIGFRIVDFTGHGVVASLNTFRMHSLISQNPIVGDDIAGCASALNQGLCRLLPPGQFATALGGIIDLRKNTVRFASAGGPKPFVKPPGEPGYFAEASGIPLGITENATYENRELPFPPGSTLLLYSDALTETPTMKDPVCDEDTIATLMNAVDDPGRDPFDRLVGYFFEHAPMPLRDDLTVLMIRRPVPPAAAAGCGA